MVKENKLTATFVPCESCKHYGECIKMSTIEKKLKGIQEENYVKINHLCFQCDLFERFDSDWPEVGRVPGGE